MSILLHLETATDTCSVAVSVNGQLAAVKEAHEVRSHIAVITLMIEACMQEAGIRAIQLNGVSVSGGPGAYTSLRTGVSTAKGLCYALDIPLISVHTLQALAAGVFETRPLPSNAICIPMLDARRNEVWLAAYNRQLLPLADAQPLVLDPDALPAWSRNLPLETPPEIWWIAGNGKNKIKFDNIINNSDICTENACSARFLSKIAEMKYQNRQFEDVASFEPFYMKPPNITVSTKTNI